MLTLTLTDREFSVIVYALNRLQSDEGARAELQTDAETLLTEWDWQVAAEEEE